MHNNLSVQGKDGKDAMPQMIAGILEKIAEMTVFLNPTEKSYERLGKDKAPRYITWSSENRSQLIRIPAAVGEYRRAEVRSPDPSANPYIAYSLLIKAGLYGIQNQLELPKPADINLFSADPEILSAYRVLPRSLEEAVECARTSRFIAECLPESLASTYYGVI